MIKLDNAIAAELNAWSHSRYYVQATVDHKESNILFVNEYTTILNSQDTIALTKSAEAVGDDYKGKISA